jgi:hypothetical protein
MPLPQGCLGCQIREQVQFCTNCGRYSAESNEFPTSEMRGKCSICMEELDDRKSDTILPGCAHGPCFHNDCLERWLQQTPKCPLCRVPALLQKLRSPQHSAAPPPPPWVGHTVVWRAPPRRPHYSLTDMVRHNDLEGVTRHLQREGADVNGVSATGSSTPLFIAVEMNHIALTHILLRARADTEIKGASGRRTPLNERLHTPLHVAALNGHVEVAKALCRGKADLDADITHTGDTPLHCCAWKGHDKVAWVLARARADVERTNRAGETPLHEAAHFGFGKAPNPNPNPKAYPYPFP